jgi:hypothetical protein
MAQQSNNTTTYRRPIPRLRPEWRLITYFESLYPRVTDDRSKIKKPNIDIVEDLLRRGADPNFFRGGRSPLGHVLNHLYAASRNGPIEHDVPISVTELNKLISLLLTFGADPDAQDSNGRNLLMSLLAELEPCLKIEHLLKLGARPNFRLSNETTFPFGMGKFPVGATPLMLAAKAGVPDYVKVLLQYGADPSLTDVNGDTALDWALKWTGDAGRKETIDLIEEAMQKQMDQEEARQLLGSSTDMHEFATTILEQPAQIIEGPVERKVGRRAKARAASRVGFQTNVAERAGLCNDLNNNMYKDELYALAKELDLPVTNRLSKKELCELLASYGFPEGQQNYLR